MAYRTDDPHNDFSCTEFEMERKAKQRPVCHACGERIYGRKGYLVKGEYTCPMCFDGMYYVVDLDDFAE